MIYYCDKCGIYLGRDSEKLKCPVCGFITIPPVMESLPSTKQFSAREKLLIRSQPPKALVITSHARLRIKQRDIQLKPLIKWLKSQQYITMYLSDSNCEILLPSNKRLVGEIDGNIITINTALLETHESRLNPNNIKKTMIRLSNHIAVAKMEKEPIE